MKKLALAAVLVVAMREAIATDADGFAQTVDSVSCGKYVDARKHIDGAFYDQILYYNQIVFYNQIRYWVSGYITAYNTWTPENYNILGNTDHKSVMLWLENYCKANPLKQVGHGMQALMVELFPKRHRTAKDARP